MKDANTMKMPKVGDRIMRTMTTTCFRSNDDKPEPCVVIYVSKPKHYYTVQFVDSGIKESYKVPHIDELADFKKAYERALGKKAVGVYVFESGMLYPSIAECAKDLGVRTCTISNHLHGRTRHVKGYHIYMLG